MNGIILFVMGMTIGIVILMVISCIIVASDENSHDKQLYDFYELGGVLFATLVYYMSDSIDKETIINYITNAIKISVNKDWIELKKDDVQIYDCAESLYESVMKTFERGDE